MWLSLLFWLVLACLLSIAAGYLSAKGNRSAGDPGDVFALGGIGCLGAMVTTAALACVFAVGYVVLTALAFHGATTLGIPNDAEGFRIVWWHYPLWILATIVALLAGLLSVGYGSDLATRVRRQTKTIRT